MNIRVYFAIAAVVIATTAHAEDFTLNSLARRLDYSDYSALHEWTQKFYKRDFSKLPPDERGLWRKAADMMDDSATAQNIHIVRDPDYLGTGDTALLIRIKLGDPDALNLVRRHFKRGYFWASQAAKMCETAGDLFLIPIAAETLFTDKPEKEVVEGGDVTHDPSPAVYSAKAINGILRWNPYFSEAVHTDSLSLSRGEHGKILPIYRLWWAANKDAIMKGNFDAITSPIQFASKP